MSSASASSSSSTCYYPNGDPSPGDIPCGTGDAVVCCPLNWSCETNGLCYLPNEAYYGRYTCTDETWQSDSCPQICTHGGTAPGDEAVLQCSSGSYCCDTNRPDPGCCDTTTTRFTLDSLPIIASMDDAPASSSTISSSSDTPPSSPAFTSTTTSSSDTPPPSPTSTSTLSSSTPLPAISTTPTPTFTSMSDTLPSNLPILMSITLDQATTTSPASSVKSASSTTSSAHTQAARSTPSSSTTISIFTQVVTQNGAPSTLITSTSTPVATSTTAPPPAPQPKSLFSTIVPAVVVPIAALTFAALAFFLFRRSRRSRRNHPTPRMIQTDPLSPNEPPPSHSGINQFQKPSPCANTSPELDGSPIATTFEKDARQQPNMSPSTAPPSYRGISGLYEDQATRDSRGSELVGSPISGATGSPRIGELHGNTTDTGELGGGGEQPSEMLGSIYRPYRSPGIGR